MRYVALALFITICFSGCFGKKGAEISSIDYSDKSLTLEKIFFDKRSDKLAVGSERFVAKDVDVLKANPKMKVTIEGHCDMRELKNKKDTSLCEKRATVVKEMFVNGGIDAERLTIKNMGIDHPLEYGRDESSRAWNRRVEFVRQ